MRIVIISLITSLALLACSRSISESSHKGIEAIDSDAASTKKIDAVFDVDDAFQKDIQERFGMKLCLGTYEQKGDPKRYIIWAEPKQFECDQALGQNRTGLKFMKIKNPWKTQKNGTDKRVETDYYNLTYQGIDAAVIKETREYEQHSSWFSAPEERLVNHRFLLLDICGEDYKSKGINCHATFFGSEIMLTIEPAN